MLFSASTNYKFFVKDYMVQNDKLSASMRRLSSGRRFIVPGEAPADTGISARFKAQIVNTEEASRVIQNATNLFQTSDAFMQNSSDILNRMSELAISAFDSSKNQGDRKNLDLEFQQLKHELARISEVGKYNGLQINGKTGVAVWDAFDEQIVYYQPDGTGQRETPYVMSSDNASQNGINYQFVSSSSVTGDFQFTSDGKSLVYFAQGSTLNDSTTVVKRNTLMKLDLSDDTVNYVVLASGEADTLNAMSGNYGNKLKMDNQGRLWASYAVSGGAGGAINYTLGLVRENEITVDAGGADSTNDWAGGVQISSAYSKGLDFAVADDGVYFIERNGTANQYVRRDMFDQNTTQVLVENLSAMGLHAGSGQSYAVSNDGRYIAYEGGEDDIGTIFVLDAYENKRASLIVGTTELAITDLGFDFNNNLYWTDTGATTQKNAIQKVRIGREDDGTPEFLDQEVLVNGNVGRFGVLNSAIASAVGGGLSITGGSPATNYQFQTGPDATMHVEMQSADVRLFTLGVSNLDVRSMEAAEDAIAKVQEAISIVANQRAIVGSEVSRLSYTLGTNQSYSTNISAAESRLSDVDVAKESSRLASSQILSQTAQQILQFNNSNRQSVLGFLSSL